MGSHISFERLFLLATDPNNMELKRVAGGTFNVTNGEGSSSTQIEMWNLFLKKFYEAFGDSETRGAETYFGLDFVLFCIWIEVILVLLWPCPVSSTFNMECTRASIGFACTPITLDISKTVHLLGYTPLYSTVESFDDIINKMQRRQTRIANITPCRSARKRSSRRRKTSVAIPSEYSPHIISPAREIQY